MISYVVATKSDYLKISDIKARIQERFLWAPKTEITRHEIMRFIDCYVEDWGCQNEVNQSARDDIKELFAKTFSFW